MWAGVVRLYDGEGEITVHVSLCACIKGMVNPSQHWKNTIKKIYQKAISPSGNKTSVS